jgi:hypothetical protein
MSFSEVVIEGTLKPDGTLELDQKPNLRPGRVTVILRQGAAAKPPGPLGDAFFQGMEAMWAGQKARGHVPRSVEEVEAERRQLRQEWDAEVDTAIRLQEESRRLRRRAENGKETP